MIHFYSITEKTVGVKDYRCMISYQNFRQFLPVTKKTSKGTPVLMIFTIFPILSTFSGSEQNFSTYVSRYTLCSFLTDLWQVLYLTVRSCKKILEFLQRNHPLKTRRFLKHCFKLSGTFHPAFFQKVNFVGIFNSRQPVSYDYHGILSMQSFNIFLNHFFSFRIKSGSSFIQNHDFGIFKQLSCYRNPLLLSATDHNTIITKLCIFFFRLSLNEFGQGCQLHCFPEFFIVFRSPFSPEGDIVENIVIENHSLL